MRFKDMVNGVVLKFPSHPGGKQTRACFVPPGDRWTQVLFTPRYPPKETAARARCGRSTAFQKSMSTSVLGATISQRKENVCTLPSSSCPTSEGALVLNAVALNRRSPLASSFAGTVFATRKISSPTTWHTFEVVSFKDVGAGSFSHHLMCR